MIEFEILWPTQVLQRILKISYVASNLKKNSLFQTSDDGARGCPTRVRKVIKLECSQSHKKISDLEI